MKTEQNKPKLAAILAPPGTGKTHFTRLWQNTLNVDFSDSDTDPFVVAIYGKMFDRFGSEWWKSEEATKQKNEMMAVYVAREIEKLDETRKTAGGLESYRHKDKLIFTSEPLILSVGERDPFEQKRNRLAVVIPPFDVHEGRMNDRNNENLRGKLEKPVYMRFQLTSIRKAYFDYAKEANILVFEDFADAFNHLFPILAREAA
jgi:hypothetical protein